MNFARIFLPIMLCFTWSPAKAEISICNFSKNKIVIAVAVQRAFQAFSDTWTTRGWIHIEDGCKTISGGKLLLQSAAVIAFQWDETNNSYKQLFGEGYQTDNPTSTIRHWGETRAYLDLYTTGNGFWFCATDQDNLPFGSRGVPRRNLSNCASNQSSKRASFYVWHSSETELAEVTIHNNKARFRAFYRQ